MAPTKPKKKQKEVKALLTLQIPAGQATPAPPLGPTLGQNGIVIPDFVNEFNEKTREKMGDVLPVKVTVFKDGSYKMKIKQPTVAGMIKKTLNLQKGSGNPKTEKVGKISKKQMQEIATRKLPDLNTNKLESATKIVEGTARSLGIEIVD